MAEQSRQTRQSGETENVSEDPGHPVNVIEKIVTGR